MASKQIHEEMTIAEVISASPHHAQRVTQALTNAGLHCSGCHAATWETLQAGMKSHGKEESEIVSLVAEINKVINEELDLTTIAFTPRGAKKFREISAEEGLPTAALRFGDSAGGCGGFEYILDFSESSAEDDAVFTSHGIEIHVKKGMVKRLLGCVIDFVDGLQGGGFKISNPNVKSSCACGHSQDYSS